MQNSQEEYHHRKLIVRTTAHYFTAGNRESDHGILMTHGYGMTGEQVIRKFDQFDDDTYLRISAEGLSHFYLETRAERPPVASWMTSRFRLDAISDYCEYLSILFGLLDGKKKYLFGFSQGGTTMWRFINQVKPDFDVFINWAGDIPDDSIYDPTYLSGRKLIYVSGSADQYITEERRSIVQQRCVQKGLDVDFQVFEGEHRINKSVLSNLFLENQI